MKKLSNRFAKLCLLASAIAIVAAVFQLFYSVKLGRVAYIAENVSWVLTMVVLYGHETWTIFVEDRVVFERKVLLTIDGGVQMEDGTWRR